MNETNKNNNSNIENEMNIVFEGSDMQTPEKEVENWINSL